MNYSTMFDWVFDAIDNGRDWVFFSPSELLREYLADAMYVSLLLRLWTGTENGPI